MTARAAPPVRTAVSSVLRFLSIAGAVGYPLALAIVALAFRFVGERWWVTAAGLYLPRVGFGLPLPFVAVAAYVWTPRRYLALQLLSLAILLFPLMGLSPGLGRLTARAAGPSVRLVSHNIDGGRGMPAFREQVASWAPDLVLLQDAPVGIERSLQDLFSGWQVRHDGEFAVASRYPISDVFVPPPLMYAQGSGGAHFVRYSIETPLGAVDVFNVHTTSPRPGLEEVRGGGLRGEIESGRLLAGKAAAPVESNAYRRRRQIEGVAAAARSSTRPVIIAGDTNLPGLSWILNEYLGGFRDAFSRAGAGFGYTFPSNRPWMRIDRVLTDDRLRAVKFAVGGGTASDHRAVFAVIGPGR